MMAMGMVCNTVLVKVFLTICFISRIYRFTPRPGPGDDQAVLASRALARQPSTASALPNPWTLAAVAGSPARPPNRQQEPASPPNRQEPACPPNPASPPLPGKRVSDWRCGSVWLKWLRLVSGNGHSYNIMEPNSSLLLLLLPPLPPELLVKPASLQFQTSATPATNLSLASADAEPAHHHLRADHCHYQHYCSKTPAFQNVAKLLLPKLQPSRPNRGEAGRPRSRGDLNAWRR